MIFSARWTRLSNSLVQILVIYSLLPVVCFVPPLFYSAHLRPSSSSPWPVNCLPVPINIAPLSEQQIRLLHRPARSKAAEAFAPRHRSTAGGGVPGARPDVGLLRPLDVQDCAWLWLWTRVPRLGWRQVGAYCCTGCTHMRVYSSMHLITFVCTWHTYACTYACMHACTCVYMCMCE